MRRAIFAGIVVLVTLAAAAPFARAGDSGQLSGRVIVTGTWARPKPHPVFKNRSFCGANVANETFQIDHDGGLRNAAVIMQPVTHAPVVPAQISLDNQNCAFVPHVQIAPVGSELLLKNSDPILHTVHARMGRETLFNVGLPKWRRVTKSLTRVGIVRVDCDVLHTWMSAAIVVVATPYHGLTDGRGEFHIPMVPVGEYRVDIWHEKLGSQSTRVVIAPGVTAVLEVVYRANAAP
ncbi:MAG: hypothetical protein FJ145_20020 [Deltaproteobacteria bacterium]|nr:hypothetical protein [Deltaproteobacteria bacterium]